MKKKVALHTLGCKLNYAETSMLGERFNDRGYEIVDSYQRADVYILNTCSVTERASRECRQVIRRMHRQAPDATIVVVGCYAQLEPEKLASIEGVDLVLGTKEKFSVIEYLDKFDKITVPRIHVGCIDNANDFGPAYSSVRGDRTRAFLKVQDGCDYMCSFCTIPMARGGSRSQDIPTTVYQARGLVERGFREIVLTGVNVGDYGRKIKTSLLNLLEQLDKIEGLERIRISSIEPNLLNDSLLEFIKGSSKVCRHFHVPLQSGHDTILKAMRRRYLTADYTRLIHKIKNLLPNSAIGADVIVGFPGETDDHFIATHKLLTELPVSYLHVFSYSERINTAASNMADRINPDTRTRRSSALRNLALMKKKDFYRSFLGATTEILVEKNVIDGVMEGFTDNYIRVQIPADLQSKNHMRQVLLKSYDPELEICQGEVL